MKIFEKLAALLFLMILVGIIMFLTYIPLSGGSKDAIMMIIGALTAASTSALPKLFGIDKNKEEALQKEIEELHTDIKVLTSQLYTLKQSYDDIVELLVKHYTEYKAQLIRKDKDGTINS